IDAVAVGVDQLRVVTEGAHLLVAGRLCQVVSSCVKLCQVVPERTDLLLGVKGDRQRLAHRQLDERLIAGLLVCRLEAAHLEVPGLDTGSQSTRDQLLTFCSAKAGRCLVPPAGATDHCAATGRSSAVRGTALTHTWLDQVSGISWPAFALPASSRRRMHQLHCGRSALR